MLPALVALALVALALAVLLVVARRSLAAERRRGEASRQELEGRLAEAAEVTTAVEAARDEALERAAAVEGASAAAVTEAEARVAAAEEGRAVADRARTAAEATVSETATLAARLIDDGAADPAALWALERARTERTWRHSVAAVAGVPSPLRATGEPLRVALEIEVAAVREEVGAVIDLTVAVPEPVTPGVALATLRVTQELLAAVAKQGEVTSVAVTTDGADLVVRVEAFDAEGEPLGAPPLVLPPSRLEPEGPAVRLRDALAPAADVG